MFRMNEGQLFAPELFESEEDKEEERVFNIHGIQVRIFACPDHMQMTASGAYRRVWPSSVALAEFVLSKDLDWFGDSSIAKDTVIELGAGAGLCGISLAASLRYKEVILTDIDRDVLRLLRLNVQLYKDTASVEDLSWQDINKSHLLAEKNAHLLLGADVTYDQSAIPALVKCGATLLPRGGAFLLALSFPRFADRVAQVEEHAALHGFVVQEMQCEKEVTILRLSWQKVGGETDPFS
ncbi:hypothetical protein NDN08_003097 [Rhodosorus marinus]|uniref:Calmodulin-lysine N-methyltransferase n=1 Tax=Rhodosorus marinus TaxID=101924 RepID=A0AAV8UVP1_9RHOD|nr:hypothetical protein NDN08_003097 [Rhodosorus marinus]